MSERYSKLSSLPENLYAEGAPVIVSAGNLLKDNQTGRVLAQLKIKNIAAKPLKAATVLIHPLDTTGTPMTGETEQKYLDLTAKTGEEFGQKTAVYLPDDSTRGLAVEVTQVVFSDNSTWEGSAAPWEPLPAGESLSSWLGDGELVKQYRIKFGESCEVYPREHKGLWLCACGAWNRDEACYVCGKKKTALLPPDLEALKAEKDARLAKEKAEREAKEAADKAAAEAKAKKTKKTLAILIPAVAVCVAALLIFKVFIPNSKYNKAVALLDAGQYDEAITAFEALNGYKDSADMIEEARCTKIYDEAEKQFASGNYDASFSMFASIEPYRDSSSRMKEVTRAKEAAEMDALFQHADELITSGNYKDAAAVLDSLAKKHYQGASDRLESIYPGLYDLARSSASASNFTDALDTISYLPDSYKNVASLKSYLTVRSINFDDGEAHNLASICDSIDAMDDKSHKEQLITETQQISAILALNGSYIGNQKDIYNRTMYARVNGGRFFDDNWEDIYYCDGRYYIPRGSYDVRFSFRGDQAFTVSNDYWSYSYSKRES